LCWASACGPIEYVGHVTFGASDKVEAARAADAAKWSPYWWTRAVEYLHKAKVEAAGANFEAANHFGRLSEEAAEHAREEALRRAADPAAAAKEMGPIDGGATEAPKAPAEKPDKKPAKKDLAPVEEGS
jgi:sRNA-binding protein